jgi:hypothetical protein
VKECLYYLKLQSALKPKQRDYHHCSMPNTKEGLSSFIELADVRAKTWTNFNGRKFYNLECTTICWVTIQHTILLRETFYFRMFLLFRNYMFAFSVHCYISVRLKFCGKVLQLQCYINGLLNFHLGETHTFLHTHALLLKRIYM